MAHNDYSNITVDFNEIIELMDNNSDHLKKFYEAVIVSFERYKGEYEQYLNKKEIKKFKKAGHRIKPTAQMLKLKPLIEEYEQTKQLLLINGIDDKTVQRSITKIKTICDHVIERANERKQQL